MRRSRDGTLTPYVLGEVFLSRLGITFYVELLIDTGSSTTVIHPMDWAKRLPRYAQESQRESISLTGISG